MPGGTRHAKNNTASSFFTYHEKQKLDYGLKKQRLGKDSLQNFDCCRLTLAPAEEPMVTPRGFLYSKEAIYSNLLKQKKIIKRKKALWKAQQSELQAEEAKAHDMKLNKTVKEFEALEDSIKTKQKEVAKKAKTVTEVRKDIDEYAKELKSFWVPSLTPTPEAASTIDKPDGKTYCPTDGKPLRVNQLVAVSFTPLENVSAKDADRVGRYMCPICYNALSNKTKISALSSGKILCRTCVKKFVLPDMKDPFTGEHFTKSDIIPIKTGGTGYAGNDSGDKLVAEKQRPAFV